MKGRHGRRPAGKVSAHLDHPAGEGWRRFNAEAAYAQRIFRSALGDAQFMLLCSAGNVAS
jgi:hypothetical protein